jgi:dTDP-4-dehydrorhamnose 3,5-epimerase
MPFHISPTDLPDVILIEPKVFEDPRGFFMEAFKSSDFRALGLPHEFVQDNHSRSVKGVLRGLHYQLPPYAQGKLVRCFSGEIFDVAVDIRRSSATFLKWVGYRLSAENKRMLYIPPGFAHGFYTFSESAEVYYKTTTEYAAGKEQGIIWNDPQIGIKWPAEDVRLSEKDANLPGITGAVLPD